MRTTEIFARSLSSLLTIVFLTGCSAGGLGLQPDGGIAAQDVVSGIYELTITTNSDSCDPLRTSGDVGQVPLINLADQMRIWTVARPQSDKDSGLGKEYDLAATNGYSVVEDDRATDSCRHHLDAQFLSATRTEVSVGAIEDLQVPCPGLSWDGDPPPHTDCHSDQMRTYTLVTPCPSPKLIVDGAIAVNETAGYSGFAFGEHFRCVDP